MKRHAGAHDITLGELKLNRTRLCPIKETAALVCFEFVTRSSPRFTRSKEIPIKHRAVKFDRFVVRFAISWRT